MRASRAQLTRSEQKALGVFAVRLRRICGRRLRALKVFGSAARGERGEESDVDILVVIEGLTWNEKRGVWDEATSINIKCDALLSPFVITPQEFKELRRRERRIAMDIEKEGIAI